MHARRSRQKNTSYSCMAWSNSILSHGRYCQSWEVRTHACALCAQGLSVLTSNPNICMCTFLQACMCRDYAERQPVDLSWQFATLPAGQVPYDHGKLMKCVHRFCAWNMKEWALLVDVDSLKKCWVISLPPSDRSACCPPRSSLRWGPRYGRGCVLLGAPLGQRWWLCWCLPTLRSTRHMQIWNSRYWPPWAKET